MNNSLTSVNNGLHEPLCLLEDVGSEVFDCEAAVKLIKDLQQGVEYVKGGYMEKVSKSERKGEILIQLQRNCEKLLYLINHSVVIDEAGSELLVNVGYENQNEFAGGHSSNDNKFLDQVICEINKNLDDPRFDVKSLSDSMGFSSNYIYRRIRSLTGSTIKQFIRDYRIRVAARFLLQDDVKINEVVYKVGFTSPSYFTACFKRFYFCSPTEYKLRKI